MKGEVAEACEIQVVEMDNFCVGGNGNPGLGSEVGNPSEQSGAQALASWLGHNRS